MNTHPIVIAKVLHRAGDIVREGWCQGWFSLDAQGARVSPESIDAVAWCAAGAVKKASGEILGSPERGIDLYELLPGRALCSNWNDTPGRTADEVAQALYAAAAQIGAGA